MERIKNLHCAEHNHKSRVFSENLFSVVSEVIRKRVPNSWTSNGERPPAECIALIVRLWSAGDGVWKAVVDVPCNLQRVVINLQRVVDINR